MLWLDGKIPKMRGESTLFIFNSWIEQSGIFADNKHRIDAQEPSLRSEADGGQHQFIHALTFSFSTCFLPLPRIVSRWLRYGTICLAIVRNEVNRSRK